MIKPSPIGVPGFSPENIERIYLGEPALVGAKEKPAEDVLSDREYEVAQLAVQGFVYKTIAGEVGRSLSMVRTHLHSVYSALGVSSHIELAGFFPLDSDDPLLEGKTLGQISPRGLEVTEGLSVGSNYKTIAIGMGISLSTVRTHLHNAMEVWPGCKGKAVNATRIANGVRASYTSRINGNGRSIRGRTDGYALHNLVDHEQRIRGLIKKQSQPDS